jgi:hypothetical protein
MALRDPAVGGSKSEIKTSAKHVVAEMEDSRTGVRFPPPPPTAEIDNCQLRFLTDGNP